MLGGDKLKEYGNIADKAVDDIIGGFISSEVIGRGLDERTEKAYRLDLEHLCQWMGKEQLPEDVNLWKERIEQYISYLCKEKRLKVSTISRKYRVFGCFLAYLAKRGERDVGESRVQGTGGLKFLEKKSGSVTVWDVGEIKAESENEVLSKQEVDDFFQAFRKEQKELDSDFRRRLCLRDQVMMKLLFFHGVEISELLNMEISDYDLKSGKLMIRKKRKKGYSVWLFSKELREQMEQWLDEHEYFEKDEEFRTRMFLSKLGRPLSMKMIILIFEKYRILAGIKEEFTPKDLKNSLNRYGQELVRERCE